MSYGISFPSPMFHPFSSEIFHIFGMVAMCYSAFLKAVITAGNVVADVYKCHRWAFITQQMSLVTHTLMQAHTYLVYTHTHTWNSCLKHYSLQSVTITYLVSRWILFQALFYQFQVRNERQRREKNERKAAGVKVMRYYQGRGHAAGAADAEPSPLAHCGPPPSLSWRSPLYYTYQHTSTIPWVRAVQWDSHFRGL